MHDDAGDQTVKRWHASLMPAASIFVLALFTPPSRLRSGIIFIGLVGMRSVLH